MKKAPTKSISTKSARRFRLGPATTLAIGAAITIGYFKWPEYAREAQSKRELQATRAEIARRGPTQARAPQDLEAIWARRETLNLSKNQLDSLAALRAQETRETAVLRRETDAAQREFLGWMKQNPNGASLAEIQKRSAIYSAKSADLADARGSFWARGLGILSAEQRLEINRV